MFTGIESENIVCFIKIDEKQILIFIMDIMKKKDAY